jgi:hypothetical protein
MSSSMHLPIISLHNVQATGRTMAELTEAEIGQLTALRDAAYDRPGTWARNILCFHYSRCVLPPTGWDNGDPKSNHPQPPTVAEERATTLQVYPNPATTWVTFAYELEATPTDTWITVVDAAGRKVARLSVAAKQGQVAWDPRGLVGGAYTVELRSNGLLLESTTLVVQ